MRPFSVRAPNKSSGDRVRDLNSGNTGISKGPVFRYGIYWILVEWDSNL